MTGRSFDLSAETKKEDWEAGPGSLSLPQTEGLQRHSPNVFALVVSGDSLQGDGIEDGDTILVDPDAGLQVGSIHIVRVENGLCARHVFLEDGRVRLAASNDRYGEIIVKELELVGKAVGYIKYRGL